jgi:predicted lactoylglutathione lyase
MATKIFINLAVKDLNKTVEFFTKLGFKFNPQFTNEHGTCMIVSDDIFVMLLVEQFFKSFTQKEICDAKKYTEVLIALSAESRDKVDEIVKAAVNAGGKTYSKSQDHGWMYQHAFEDLDGHQWEIAYMDPNGPPQQ